MKQYFKAHRINTAVIAAVILLAADPCVYSRSRTDPERAQAEEKEVSGPEADVKDNEKYILLARKAYRHYQNREYREADSLYRQALDGMPENHVVWNHLGAVNYKLGELNAAESAYTKALELQPDHAPAWRNLSMISLYNRNWRKAAERASRAAGLEHSTDNLRYAGYTYMMAGKAERGEKRLDMYRQAAVYYRRIEDPSGATRMNLEKLEKKLEESSGS
ncbi:MAG: tetratricopeptide repeat protein [Candidatus Omnitrophica bacterium]|nr:tetratricopeptide repeat protein [Candidatus Omnitrophota bacterium]